MAEQEVKLQYLKRGRFNIPTETVESVLLDLLEKNDPMTREEMHKKTNIPWTTIYDTLKPLISKKVTCFTTHNKRRGRPKVYWKKYIPIKGSRGGRR